MCPSPLCSASRRELAGARRPRRRRRARKRGRYSHILPVRTRLQGYYVWDTLDFLVNAVLFVLIGLQLHHIIDGLPSRPAGTLAVYAAAVTAVVVITRLLWFFTTPYIVFAVNPRSRESDRGVGARGWLVAAWCGMRGAVSLAVALALPLTTKAGQLFPQRNLIIFITFAVISFTLVVQGLSLPALIHRLGINDREADEAKSSTPDCARPRPRSLRSTPSRAKTGRVTTRSSDYAPSTTTANVDSPPAPARSTTPTATRNDRSPGSKCSGRSSPRNERSSSPCAAMENSQTKR
jgi:hypothetical protein